MKSALLRIMEALLILICAFARTTDAKIDVYNTFGGDKSTSPRPKWDSDAGNELVNPITITTETAPMSYELKGTVIPVSTMEHKTPAIFNGAGKEGAYDGGHVLALFLGGPNGSPNIVAQPAVWQEKGSWKKLEKKIEEYVRGKMGWNGAGGHYTYADCENHNNAEAKKKRAKGAEAAAKAAADPKIITRPATFVDIEIKITEWQGTAGAAAGDANAGKIPKKYVGKLTCRDAATNAPGEVIAFEIEQPPVHVAPEKSAWKWNGAAQDSRLIPVHSFHLNDDANYLLSIALTMMSVFVILCGCCMLPFICGFASGFFKTKLMELVGVKIEKDRI